MKKIGLAFFQRYPLYKFSWSFSSWKWKPNFFFAPNFCPENNPIKYFPTHQKRSILNMLAVVVWIAPFYPQVRMYSGLIKKNMDIMGLNVKNFKRIWTIICLIRLKTPTNIQKSQNTIVSVRIYQSGNSKLIVNLKICLWHCFLGKGGR